MNEGSCKHNMFNTMEIFIRNTINDIIELYIRISIAVCTCTACTTDLVCLIHTLLCISLDSILQKEKHFPSTEENYLSILQHLENVVADINKIYI